MRYLASLSLLILTILVGCQTVPDSAGPTPAELGPPEIRIDVKDMPGSHSRPDKQPASGRKFPVTGPEIVA